MLNKHMKGEGFEVFEEDESNGNLQGRREIGSETDLEHRSGSRLGTSPDHG